MRARLGLLVTGMVIAGAVCVAASGPSRSPIQGAPATAPPSSVQVIRVDGYPLDRTLKGLVGYSKLDAALLLSGVKLGKPHWTTPGGDAPSYIAQNRPPNLDEVRRNDLIVTPVTGRISEVLRGAQFSAGDTVTFVVAGGRVENVEVRADEEIAPNLDRLSRGDLILLAGEVRKSTVIASFVYRLEADGNTVKSLLKSASVAAPDFSLEELKRALTAKL